MFTCVKTSLIVELLTYQVLGVSYFHKLFCPFVNVRVHIEYIQLSIQDDTICFNIFFIKII